MKYGVLVCGLYLHYVNEYSHQPLTSLWSDKGRKVRVLVCGLFFIPMKVHSSYLTFLIVLDHHRCKSKRILNQVEVIKCKCNPHINLQF